MELTIYYRLNRKITSIENKVPFKSKGPNSESDPICHQYSCACFIDEPTD